MKKSVVSLIVMLCVFAGINIPIKAAKNMGYMWPTPGYGDCSRGVTSYHFGVDIKAALGADVYASKSGTIVKKYTGCNNYNQQKGKCENGGACNPIHGYSRAKNIDGTPSVTYGYCNDGFGNGYIIKHDDGTWTEYAHMNYLSDNISEGEYISQGTYLGKVNSTGVSSGPHLHFGLRQGGNSFWSATVLNPLDYMDADDSGGTAPTNVSLSTDSTIYSRGDSVSFSISATNSTLNKIEIYRNGLLEHTENISGNFSYTPAFAGNYSAILSSSNDLGTTQSNWIEFIVGIGSRSVSGDFNGDGRDDYATLFDYGNGRSQWHVFLSTGSEFSEEIWWQELTDDWYPASNLSGRVVAGDFNGDGFDDVAVMYEYDTFHSAIHVFTSNGIKFNTWSSWYENKTSYQSSRTTDKFIAGDFNGDGKDDIAAMYEYDTFNTQIHVFTSTGTKFEGWQAWYSNPTGYQSSRVAGKVASGDFNGDGKDDIAAMYEYDTFNTQIHVFTSTGTKFEAWRTWYSDPTAYQSSRAAGRFVAGDFNGDGKDDIAAMFEYEAFKGTVHVFISNGNKFDGWYGWCTDTSFAPKNISGRFLAGDFNGDSKGDIAAMYDYDGNHIIFHMYLSEMSKFTHKWWNQIDGYDARRTTNSKAYTDLYSAKFHFTKRSLPTPAPDVTPTVTPTVTPIATPTVTPTVIPTLTPTSTLSPICFTVVYGDGYADITNISGSVQTATVIVAEYRGVDLVSVNARNMIFAEGEQRSVIINHNTKIFVWDSVSGMYPLTK